MTITIREEQDAGSNSAGISFTLGGSVLSGDTVFLVQYNDFYSLSNLQTPSGTAVTTWNLRNSYDGGTDSYHAKVWEGEVTTAGGTVVVNSSTTDEERYAALVVLAPCTYDTSSFQTGAASTDHVAPSVTPTTGKTDDQLVCVWNNTNSNSTVDYTVPGSMTGYTERDVGGIVTWRAASEQLTSDAATGTRTATLAGGGQPYLALSLLVKAVSAATNANAECATAAAAANDATVTTTNIRKIADRGSTQNLTSQSSTTVDLAAGGSITVGNYLVARVALDNAGSSGAAPTLSVSDPGSNAWTVAGPANVDPGAANAGATCYIAYAKVTTGLANGDDVTFTYNVSVTAKAIVVEEWTNIHATSPVAVAATTATGTSTTPSISRTPTAVGQVVYGALAVEGPTGDTFTQDADTTDGSWVTLTRLSTTDGTAANNQTINGVYKLVSGTTAQTWNPTITSRDWAQLALVFAEAAAATNAAAENATATGVAETSATAITPVVEHATATAAAQDATVSTGGATTANAEAASATATAEDAAAAIAPTAELAAVTGVGQDPAPAIASAVEHTVATAVAEQPTVATGTNAAAENATATSDAPTPTIRVSPVVEVALATAQALFDAAGGSISLELTADSPIAVTGAANDATISTAAQTFANAQNAASTSTAETPSVLMAVNADNAVGAGAGVDATVGTSTSAVAESAASTGAADTSAAAVALSAGNAAVTVEAFDATVSTSAATNAPAENATSTAAAEAVSASVVVSSEAVSATATATDAAVTTSGQGTASADVAPLTAVALDASTTVLFGAEIATATGAALDPAVSTSTATNAIAEAAVAAGTVTNASVAITVPAELAGVTGAAEDAAVAGLREAAAEVAAATVIAVDASGTVLVSAECAVIAVEALNSEVRQAGGTMTPIADRATSVMTSVERTVATMKGV